MKRIISTLAIIAAAIFGLGSAWARGHEPGWAHQPPELEIVAEWNSLPYHIQDRRIWNRWKHSDIFGKALMQGAKVDSKGNIYVSTARWGGKEIPATLSKLVKKGHGYVLVPFPSEAINDVNNPKGLKAVLGFEIDRNDVMWILDQGHIAGAPSGPGDEKLILWDLKTNTEIKRYEFTDADSDKTCSFLNDVVVDNDTDFAYITDSGIFCSPLDGGLLVYDLKNNKARRVLDRTMFTQNEPNFFFNIPSRNYGIRPVLKDTPMLTGADGIALSGDKKTLYWTSLTGHSLWALDTELLRDFGTPESVLQSAVRLVTTLPSNTDGMTADRDNNVYMTALTLNGLMRLNAKTGLVERFAFHPEMSWADTLAWGPNDALYIVSNHLNVWVDGDMNFHHPRVPNFRIWRIPNVGKSYTAP
jgi:sugar lactone lactonase YvrE